ncbi:TPA: type II secretion system protein [Candidatus Scatousia excrementigallinarum]|uniref:Type II secretion system protein n=1 Tax=Candidatus Scatousia excrementigallinarum TaxID=2840935 RepID=A0A9D1EXM4_9BACT|nr:type II secretion system protein [Candidatus Scatousia excrementigallinarum]
MAEVLVTLGIIGVVAALTLPVLTEKTKAKEFETQFKVAENLIHNAVNYMHANGREIYGVTYCTANSNGVSIVEDCKNLEVFSEVLAEAFNGIRALNKYDNNWATTGHKYRTFSNSGEFKASLLDDGYMELINGMSIMIESGSASTLPIISIDINGPYKKPNRFGYDTFSFVIDKGDRVCPLGSPACKSSSYSKNPENYCSKTSKADNNGFTCGYFASTDKNYFKNLK